MRHGDFKDIAMRQGLLIRHVSWGNIRTGTCDSNILKNRHATSDTPIHTPIVLASGCGPGAVARQDAPPAAPSH